MDFISGQSFGWNFRFRPNHPQGKCIFGRQRNVYQTKVPSDPNYSYQNVALGDAVKIGDFNEPYDSSFMCYICLSIESKHLGHLECEASPTRRGRPLETVILWDTLEKDENIYHVNFKLISTGP